MKHLNKLPTNESKNLYLQDLQNRNETLYFKVLVDHLEQLAPLVYTPTVGEVCKKFGLQYARARGMYFSKYDRGFFASMAHNWPHSDVHVIVVTDGSRVLGLGDLGVNGMGIPIGKLGLYCAAGGVAPHRVLPVCLDVGTNNKELLNDEEYMGIKEFRLEGDEYIDLVDEFMAAVVHRWPNCLVQFEDFESSKAGPLLERYRNKYRMFNDDIQGTGAVTLAGLLGAIKISKQDMKNVRVLCAGAGSAGIGVCKQLLDGMVEAGNDLLVVFVVSKQWSYVFVFFCSGLSRKQAQSQFALSTVHGVIGQPSGENGNPNYKDGNINPMHIPWINSDIPDGTKLLDAIKRFKPNVLLGLSTAGGIFNEEIVRAMGELNERPIILPMSNPTSHAECTPADAYKWTDGRAIVATGSPFDPVEFQGKTLFPSQANNMFVFPGIGMAASVSGVQRITDKMLYEAAVAISESLTKEEEEQGRVFPHVRRIRDVSKAVAQAVIEEGHERNLLTKISSVEHLDDLLSRKTYVPFYSPLIASRN